MQFSYYAFSDKIQKFNTCSLQSDEYPLIVNCMGNVVASKAFLTDNVGGREDFYLLCPVKGSMRVFLDSTAQTVTIGDVILFPPHYRYRYAYDGKDPLEYFFVHFTGSYAERFLEECQLSPLPCIRHAEDSRRIGEEFHRLFQSAEDQTHLQKHALACALERLLLTVAQSVHASAQDRTLENSLRILHSAYHSDLRIPDLAKAENLSHSRYIELFRQKMGVSPTAYLIRLRLRAACELLESTDIPVKQIARMVGYDDPHFFSKLFKKHVGSSPNEWRKNS